MPISSFHVLSSGFCDLAGVGAPALQPDAHGALAFSVRLRGVDLTLVELIHSSNSAFALVAELGNMPEQQARAGWLALLDANFTSAAGVAPCYSCNPQTGTVVLQWTAALQDVAYTDVYQWACKMADAALLWRAGYFLDLQVRQPDPQAFSLLEDASRHAEPAAAQWQEKFNAMYRGLCEAVGQPAQQVTAAVPTRTLSMRVADMDVAMIHSSVFKPEVVFVGVLMNSLPEVKPLHLEALLRANFAFAANPHSAKFCRNPFTGDLLLQYAYPLADANGADCLARLVSMVALAHEWTATVQAADAAPIADRQDAT